MYLGHGRVTHQRHREVELGEGVLDDGLHPFGARERQTVDVGPPEDDGVCPERERRENVRARAHPGVEEHGEIADLVTAIGEGTDPSPSFAEALHVQRVLAAVEASDADGSRWTAVGPQHPTTEETTA